MKPSILLPLACILLAALKHSLGANFRYSKN